MDREKHELFYMEFAREYLKFFGNANPTQRQLKEMRLLLSRLWVQKTICLDSRLTQREKQCLYLSAFGHTLKEVAIFVDISVRQIEGYRQVIFRKLACKNIAQAVAQGLRFGEINPPDLPSDESDLR